MIFFKMLPALRGQVAPRLALRTSSMVITKNAGRRRQGGGRATNDRIRHYAECNVKVYDTHFTTILAMTPENESKADLTVKGLTWLRLTG